MPEIHDCEDSKAVEEELKKLRIPDETSTRIAKDSSRYTSVEALPAVLESSCSLYLRPRLDPAEDLCEVLNRCHVTTCRIRSSPSTSFLKTSNSSVVKSQHSSCRPLLRRSRLKILKRCRYLRKPKLNYVKFNDLSTHSEPSDQSEESISRNPNTSIIQSTCSQQAMNPCPNEDDTSIEELAAYFDCLVYIPKKMSQMAEMMYT